MIPKEKVEAIVSKHNNIEKELSSGQIDPKTFATKSKEYSDLGNIIVVAKEYLKRTIVYLLLTLNCPPYVYRGK